MRTASACLLLALLLPLPAPAAEAVPAEAPAEAPAGWLEDPAALLRTDIALRALGLVGTPYRRGGNTPEQGLDCSGLVRFVFNGVAELPRVSSDIFRRIGDGVEKGALQAGDLVFFRIGRLGQQVDHVGITLGDGRFVHAPASGGAVRIDRLDDAWWARRYAGGGRVPLRLPPAADSAAEEVGLAERHALVAQDVVGGGEVEVEVRQ